MVRKSFGTAGNNLLDYQKSKGFSGGGSPLTGVKANYSDTSDSDELAQERSSFNLINQGINTLLNTKRIVQAKVERSKKEKEAEEKQKQLDSATSEVFESRFDDNISKDYDSLVSRVSDSVYKNLNSSIDTGSMNYRRAATQSLNEIQAFADSAIVADFLSDIKERYPTISNSQAISLAKTKLSKMQKDPTYQAKLSDLNLSLNQLAEDYLNIKVQELNSTDSKTRANALNVLRKQSRDDTYSLLSSNLSSGNMTVDQIPDFIGNKEKRSLVTGIIRDIDNNASNIIDSFSEDSTPPIANPSNLQSVAGMLAIGVAPTNLDTNLNNFINENSTSLRPYLKAFSNNITQEGLSFLSNRNIRTGDSVIDRHIEAQQRKIAPDAVKVLNRFPSGKLIPNNGNIEDSARGGIKQAFLSGVNGKKRVLDYLSDVTKINESGKDKSEKDYQRAGYQLAIVAESIGYKNLPDNIKEYIDDGIDYFSAHHRDRIERSVSSFFNTPSGGSTDQEIDSINKKNLFNGGKFKFVSNPRGSEFADSMGISFPAETKRRLVDIYNNNIQASDLSLEEVASIRFINNQMAAGNVNTSKENTIFINNALAKIKQSRFELKPSSNSRDVERVNKRILESDESKAADFSLAISNSFDIDSDDGSKAISNLIANNYNADSVAHMAILSATDYLKGDNSQLSSLNLDQLKSLMFNLSKPNSGVSEKYKQIAKQFLVERLFQLKNFRQNAGANISSGDSRSDKNYISANNAKNQYFAHGETYGDGKYSDYNYKVAKNKVADLIVDDIESKTSLSKDEREELKRRVQSYSNSIMFDFYSIPDSFSELQNDSPNKKPDKRNLSPFQKEALGKYSTFFNFIIKQYKMNKDMNNSPTLNVDGRDISTMKTQTVGLQGKSSVEDVTQKDIADYYQKVIQSRPTSDEAKKFANMFITPVMPGANQELVKNVQSNNEYSILFNSRLVQAPFYTGTTIWKDGNSKGLFFSSEESVKNGIKHARIDNSGNISFFKS